MRGGRSSHKPKKGKKGKKKCHPGKERFGQEPREEPYTDSRTTRIKKSSLPEGDDGGLVTGFKSYEVKPISEPGD